MGPSMLKRLFRVKLLEPNLKIYAMLHIVMSMKINKEVREVFW